VVARTVLLSCRNICRGLARRIAKRRRLRMLGTPPPRGTCESVVLEPELALSVPWHYQRGSPTAIASPPVSPGLATVCRQKPSVWTCIVLHVPAWARSCRRQRACPLGRLQRGVRQRLRALPGLLRATIVGRGALASSACTNGTQVHRCPCLEGHSDARVAVATVVGEFRSACGRVSQSPWLAALTWS
jgi:hypothetical protein